MRMLGSWGKLVVDQRRSRRMFKEVKYSLHLLSFSHDLHACVNVLMHIDMFSGMYSSLVTGTGTVGQVQLSLVISHDRNACGYVHTDIELFRGMKRILGTGDLLVRILRSCGKIKVNQHRSTRMSATVGTSSTLSCNLTRPERMRICSHAYRTVQRYV